MNLTEQWQKGKLPSGFYYVYLKHLEMFDIAGSSTLSEILERGNENSLEVLAPVPSYEEYQKLLSDQLAKNEGVEINAELEAENTKLKERNDSLNNRDINLCRIANGIRDENFALKSLLKECRFILREMSDVNNWLESDDCVLNYDMATECEKYATKIDQVLGEE